MVSLESWVWMSVYTMYSLHEFRLRLKNRDIWVYYIWQGKLVLSGWFFLGQNFATQTSP